MLIATNTAQTLKWGQQATARQTRTQLRWRLEGVERQLADADARAAMLRESAAFLRRELGE